jgi:tRNA U55 pseudouridine synthase TruB
MSEVKNANGKLVCCVDEKTKVVEIVQKGYKTILQFNDDGTATVKNLKPEIKTA